jgi:hypothetical protein
MMLPLLIDAIEDVPTGLAVLFMVVLFVVAIVGAGSIMWDALL